MHSSTAGFGNFLCTKQHMPTFICLPFSCSSTGTCCAPGFVLDFCVTLVKCFVRVWHWPVISFTLVLQVKNAFKQEGFSRQKRGYRNINDIEVNMSDPLFTKQWYLVSSQASSCLRARPDLLDQLTFFHLNYSEVSHIPHCFLNQCCYSFLN